MAKLNKEIFLELWPRCFIGFLGVIGLITAVILLITELGNVAANFWLTNVFAGGWAGLILLIHVIFVFQSTCCSPGPDPAFRAVVLAVIGLIASAALISFDVAFLVQPSTCILTPSCTENSVSTTIFSYGFQQGFYSVFNNWEAFKNYRQSQMKFLFQAIQVGVGALSLILYVIYLILYFHCSNKAKNSIEPDPSSQRPPNPPTNPPYYSLPSPPPPPVVPPGPQGYYPPPPPPPPVVPAAPQGYYPHPSPPMVPPGHYPPSLPQPTHPIPVRTVQVWRPPQYGQQPVPGAVPWNPYGKY